MSQSGLIYQKNNRDTKESYIETLRGVACLALVSYHAVGSSQSNGMELPQSDWLSIAQNTFIDMRMPLFSFISGFVLHFSISSCSDLYSTISKKARRLLLPMITVSTMFWLLRHIMGQSQAKLLNIYFFGYAHFWFLQATFAVVLVFFISTYFAQSIISSKNVKIITASSLGLLCAFLFIFFPDINIKFYSIDGAMYLAPFFMLGHIISKYKFAHEELPSSVKKISLIYLFALILIGLWLSVHLYQTPSTIRNALSIIIGTSFSISLCILKPRSKLLAWIGGHSYAIYLFHVIFTAATVLLFKKALPGVDIHYAWPLAVITGTLVPLLVEHIFLQFKITKLLFLGLPAARRIP